MNTNRNPIFIICTGRSGSTLLQYIMNAHDLIEAPQELHLGPLIKQMIRVSNRLFENQYENISDLENYTHNKVREQVESIIRSKISSDIWCEKSVSSIDYLDEIMAVFPDARYIFLHRDCLDFVHSALEVSKYGFHGFWFEDYILKSPQNIVNGLVEFWVMQAEKRIRLQSQTPHLIYSVKYEDIVQNTIPTITKLFNFLELPFDPRMLDNVFLHFKAGKGDLKVQSTASIHDNTGKGRNVPIKQIEKDTFNKMNNTLDLLGYNRIPSDYNFTASDQTSSSKEMMANKITTHFQNILSNHDMTEELKNTLLAFNTPSSDTVWLLDFHNSSVTSSNNPSNQNATQITLKLESLIELIDRDQNILMLYREGLLKTKASYQHISEIGKYLFG